MRIDLNGLELAQGEFHLSADASIASGEITALIGPSGGGKSTLLAAVAGFLAPVHGQLRIGSNDMAGVAPGQRPVSMLFQGHNLFPHLTVAANVGLGLTAGRKLSEADKEAVSAALQRVGLAGLGGRYPAELSGGQASRVALARALLRDRPVLLLDEPFAALGPALRHAMLDLVAEVQREKALTVLLVTHLPDDARRTAPFTSVVAEGRVSPPQPTAALLADPPQALRDYLG